MPFTQMMLFPTEFSLKTTGEGIKLIANPIKEIELLHKREYNWTALTSNEANKKLQQIRPQPLHVKINFTLDKGQSIRLYYQGKELLNLFSDDFPDAENEMEILIDKSIAEIFINNGARYIVKQISSLNKNDGLYFESDKYGPFINKLKVFEMKSMWNVRK